MLTTWAGTFCAWIFSQRNTSREFCVASRKTGQYVPQRNLVGKYASGLPVQLTVEDFSGRTNIIIAGSALH